jgi:DNA-binding NarL/FixJ family response regulator
VLVAVQSAAVREALVAMLGANDGLEIVGEAATDEQGLELARELRPHLALIEQEISGCCGWWLIRSIHHERLAQVVVALGLRGDDSAAMQAGADAYIQVGTSPREVLRAVELALASARVTQTEPHLLPDANAVLEKPALVDL